jgi:molybdate transport system ATP-binding protein
MTAGLMNSLRARFRIDRGDFSVDVDLELPGRGISALFGRSGSGKTTCLRAIAGLERARGGYVALGDEVWQDDAQDVFVPVHRRALGYVFQEASLFAHLSVRGNLEFGMKRVPRDGRRFELGPVAELLGIDALLDRRPDLLSGGERQRVAIARALANGPRLLLADEPTGALDSDTGAQILDLIRRVRDEHGMTILLVTNDDGVAAQAERILRIRDGALAAPAASAAG